jgi:hypothetical protein
MMTTTAMMSMLPAVPLLAALLPPLLHADAPRVEAGAVDVGRQLWAATAGAADRRPLRCGRWGRVMSTRRCGSSGRRCNPTELLRLLVHLLLLLTLLRLHPRR